VQFSTKNQKGLARDDQLGCVPSLIKMGQRSILSCKGPAKKRQYQDGHQRRPTSLLFPSGILHG
jgi:hypothetical protein